FLDDLAKLNIETPTHLPRASEHITEQVELIKTLEKKGFTYTTSDGIYFDTSKFADYGKLSGQKIEDKAAGARVAVKSEKRNPADFALWKFCVGENAQHILRWPNPSGDGEGFPGWHLECSAMSMKYLGETFDVHTGGVDHIPVHHENEIAQSEAATGRKFVNFWLHNEFLTVDGGKMSKSLGNLFTLNDLAQKGFEPLAFRYFCLNSNYRGKLNFSWEALQNAQNSLRKLRAEFRKLPTGKIDAAEVEKFGAALADDLNSPRALAVVWDYLKNPQANQTTILKFDTVLGLDLAKAEDEKIEISPEVQKLLDERATARAKKDFKKSDELRDRILEKGFEIEDAKSGEQILKKRIPGQDN
ncbi:MAG: class I tRNA ligase family protein, partial [Patescibacteria group bacterium]